jgi:hypothetical protein
MRIFFLQYTFIASFNDKTTDIATIKQDNKCEEITRINLMVIGIPPIPQNTTPTISATQEQKRLSRVAISKPVRIS